MWRESLGILRPALPEAEPLLLKGHERIQPPQRRIIRKHLALKRIVKLYEAWDAAEPGKGYADRAAEWRAKLPPADSDAVGDDAAHEPDSP